MRDFDLFLVLGLRPILSPLVYTLKDPKPAIWTFRVANSFSIAVNTADTAASGLSSCTCALCYYFN
jgi:hypothetical protein